jgi:endonuclease/exonuclease/phosphatase family metal-dependent hydrolase
VPIVNLHLHYGSRGQRLRQIDRLLAWLRDQHRLRRHDWAVQPIICGDFNTPVTGDDATASLQSHLADYGDYVLQPVLTPTFPSMLPRRALDFVFLPAGCRPIHCKVVKSLLSDHRPVLVEVELK